jgi:hypothetical protein
MATSDDNPVVRCECYQMAKTGKVIPMEGERHEQENTDRDGYKKTDLIVLHVLVCTENLWGPPDRGFY